MNRREMADETLTAGIRAHCPEGGEGMLMHSFSVAILGDLLARRRGLNTDVAYTAGLFHDYWLHCYCIVHQLWDEYANHGRHGAVEARMMLEPTGAYTGVELDQICEMIANHNEKDLVQSEYDELLKDADCMAQLLFASDYDQKYNYHGRDEKVLRELGVPAQE